jgi:hypothetical protein
MKLGTVHHAPNQFRASGYAGTCVLVDAVTVLAGSRSDTGTPARELVLMM